MGNKSTNQVKSTETTSKSIEQLTEQYLMSGGQVNVITRGVSGIDYSHRAKKISSSSKPNRKSGHNNESVK